MKVLSLFPSQFFTLSVNCRLPQRPPPSSRPATPKLPQRPPPSSRSSAPGLSFHQPLRRGIPAAEGAEGRESGDGELLGDSALSRIWSTELRWAAPARAPTATVQLQIEAPTADRRLLELHRRRRLLELRRNRNLPLPSGGGRSTPARAAPTPMPP
jgi:hypothetical protein